MDEPSDYVDDSGRVSGCCGARAYGQIINNFSVCSNCKEWAFFADAEEDDAAGDIS